MSTTLDPVETGKDKSSKTPSIRDRHVELQYGVFELGKAYADSAKENEDRWKAFAKVHFLWTTPKSIASFMQVYEAFHDSQDAIGNIDLNALFILSRRGAEKARQTAVSEAAAGRYVTEEQAKHLVALSR